MYSHRPGVGFFLLLILLGLVLAACGGEQPPAPVVFSFGAVPANTAELKAVVAEEDLPLLDSLPSLRSADFSGSACYGQIAAWGQRHPEVQLEYTVPFPGGQLIPYDTRALDLSALAPEQLEEAAELFAFLPGLESVDLGDETDKYSVEALTALTERFPQLRFFYSLSLAGRTVSSDVEELSYPRLDLAGYRRLKELLPLLPDLRSVDLGEEAEERPFGREELKALQALRPEVDFIYRFTLFDLDFSTTDAAMDLNHIEMDDGGQAVREAIACMPRLRYLDMDSCGVSDEEMAALRDEFPQVKVVWRVWFGGSYSVRTDVERILASRPSVGGNLKDSNIQSLKYCTDVKYLDIGHNGLVTDISFVSCMPKLEVAILAMNDWSDASPLADCPHLEYLELQTTKLEDLSPLADLKELKHLNIGHLFSLDDITPLYGLTQLERLWIGCLDPVPEEQIEEFCRLAPNCEVNTRAYDPTDGGWRYDTRTGKMCDRYALLHEQFGYTYRDYSFAWNDPKY